MSQPFPLEILSDDSDEEHHHHHHHHHQDEAPPFSFPSKKRKTEEDKNQFAFSNVVVLDDDPTPQKSSATPLHISDTPMMSPDLKSDLSLVKCTSKFSDPNVRSLSISSFDQERTTSSGGCGFICLESDHESEDGNHWNKNEDTLPDFGVDIVSQEFGDKAVHSEHVTNYTTSQLHSDAEEENVTAEQVNNATKQIPKVVGYDEEQSNQMNKTKGKKRKTAEEKLRLAEESKLKREVSICKPNLSSTTPSHVSDTPMMSPDLISDLSFVKCTSKFCHPNSRSLPISSFDQERTASSGGSGFFCLESNHESEDGNQRSDWNKNEDSVRDFGVDIVSQEFGDKAVHSEHLTNYSSSQLHSDADEENVAAEQVDNASKQIPKVVGYDEEQSNQRNKTKGKKRKTAEEKLRLAEENKLKREQEKLQKKALRVEAAEAKKLQKEQQKWDKGKFALKSIVAEIDAKVIELGSIGGHLLTRFAEKGISFRITSNPIERSILWTMSVPEHISELSSKGTEIPYVIFVYEADEFCNLVSNESLMHHVSRVQSHYSSYTICYLTNKLMAYINKREQGQYKNQSNNNTWKRPPVEEVLSKLTTDFVRVHSRQCRDEAEVADHVASLTCSLATCHHRKKLTRLSTNANGAIVPKDSIDRNLIKRNAWLKALVAIPKVQPRFALAIGKKYPTMKSLLTVYMDPSKSVHEKEFLLENLQTEGLLGEDRRVGAECSKRVYRILMAESGHIKTDDVELGADFFSRQSLRQNV